jgi:hypothetical protein
VTGPVPSNVVTDSRHCASVERHPVQIPVQIPVRFFSGLQKWTGPTGLFGKLAKFGIRHDRGSKSFEHEVAEAAETDFEFSRRSLSPKVGEILQPGSERSAGPGFRGRPPFFPLPFRWERVQGEGSSDGTQRVLNRRSRRSQRRKTTRFVLRTLGHSDIHSSRHGRTFGIRASSRHGGPAAFRLFSIISLLVISQIEELQIFAKFGKIREQSVARAWGGHARADCAAQSSPGKSARRQPTCAADARRAHRPFS